MNTTNLHPDEVFMGYVALGICSECGEDTFAQDGVCATCKMKIEESDREYFKTSLGLECE